MTFEMSQREQLQTRQSMLQDPEGHQAGAPLEV